MSLSYSPLKPRFRLALELEMSGDRNSCCYYHVHDVKNRSLSFADPLSHTWLSCRSFDLTNLAGGLHKVESMMTGLYSRIGKTTAEAGYHSRADVWLKGGTDISAATLFAKKMATLAVVLEESLLFKLVAPYRLAESMSENSIAAHHPSPKRDMTRSEYVSHVPNMAGLKPAAWNNQDPNRMYRTLSTIWSAPSLQELQFILRGLDGHHLDFYLALPGARANIKPMLGDNFVDPRIWFHKKDLKEDLSKEDPSNDYLALAREHANIEPMPDPPIRFYKEDFKEDPSNDYLALAREHANIEPMPDPPIRFYKEDFKEDLSNEDLVEDIIKDLKEDLKEEDRYHLDPNVDPRDPEKSRIWFHFNHLQITFIPKLLCIWVEVIARITELALANADDYKRCLEAIFRVQDSADQGGSAWEQLMEQVLNLGDRIPDWREQLTRYQQIELIGGLPEDGFLPQLSNW